MARKSISQVYQLKVTLRGIRPPIWRRLLVSGFATLYDLHEIIQIAMGWDDDHLHDFTVGREHFGIPSQFDWEPILDERRYRLAKVAPTEGSRFWYTYDFGDSWEHLILVEKILPAEPGVQVPVCVKGKRACPPEDVGGIWGYERFLQAFSNPDDAEYKDYHEWWNGDFDPESFDIDEVNQRLRRMWKK